MLTLKWAKKHSPHFRMNQSVTLTLCVPREHRALKRLEDFSISFCPQGGKTVGRWGTLQRPFFCGYQRQLQQSHWNQNYNVLIRMSPHLQKAKSFEAFWLSKKKKKQPILIPQILNICTVSPWKSPFFFFISGAEVDQKGKQNEEILKNMCTVRSPAKHHDGFVPSPSQSQYSSFGRWLSTI